MKIIVLLFAIALGLGATFKKSVADLQEISIRQELNQYKHQGNMLPVVEVVAPRS